MTEQNSLDSKCPSKEVLDNWTAGNLTDELADSVNDHLDVCPECEQWVENREAEFALRDLKSANIPHGEELPTENQLPQKPIPQVELDTPHKLDDSTGSCNRNLIYVPDSYPQRWCASKVLSAR